jgi:aspartate racemase
MKTVGIIGGLGPESTIEYYRFLVESYRARQTDGSYPLMIINSVDLKTMVDAILSEQLDRAADYLVAAIQKLADAGVDFAVISANTPHIVFDQVKARSPLPLISIVEAARAGAEKLNLKRLALLGTRPTMQGRFYPEVFSRNGITLISPTDENQAYVHDKYMNELVRGTILPETRMRLLGIVGEMKERDAIEGVILGGTELSLILPASEYLGLPFLNTTRIHVEAIVDELLS